jgi:hypothetical protein
MISMIILKWFADLVMNFEVICRFDNDIDECLRNNEEEECNEVSFSLYDTPSDCLF